MATGQESGPLYEKVKVLVEGLYWQPRCRSKERL
jgi:hypothetical protein